MKNLSFLLLAFTMMLFSSCFGCKGSVNPNEHVIVTVDCWNTMYAKKAGDALPRLLTTCDRVVVLPASLLNGEVNINAKFGKNRVSGSVNLSYQYLISDPIKFLGVAKFITSSKTIEDNKVDPNVLEFAENTVIDKILKDIVRDYTPSMEASDVEESQVENDIVKIFSERCKERGIVIQSPSVDVNFSPQTQEALDVISAYKLYQSVGLEELGKEVIKGKASKTTINLPSPVNVQQASDK